MKHIMKYNFSDYYILYLLIILFWVVIFLALKCLIKIRWLKATPNQKIVYFLSIGIGFSFLGLSIGLLVGLSKNPVIGVVIPALLAFYGGFISYLFLFGGKDSRIENGVIMLVILVSISFFLILGADYGAAMRVNSKIIEDELEHTRKLQLEYIKSGVAIESLNIEKSNEKTDLKITPTQEKPSSYALPKTQE